MGDLAGVPTRASTTIEGARGGARPALMSGRTVEVLDGFEVCAYEVNAAASRGHAGGGKRQDVEGMAVSFGLWDAPWSPQALPSPSCGRR